MAKKVHSQVSHAVQKVDRKVAEAVVPHRETVLVQAMDLVGKFADQPPLRMLCEAVIVTGLVRKDRKQVRAGIRMLAAHTFATYAKNIVKSRIDRTRPHAAVKKRKDHRLSPGRKTSKEETSFPSGHSAGAAAVARGFAREYPEHAVAAQAAAGALALAQIPRCAHYPTDIGAGLTIGVAADYAVDALLKAAKLSGSR